MPRVTPFLMFEGQAEEAITFYVSLFADGKILDIARNEAGGPGPEGKVMRARFRVAGQEFMAFDSPVHHAFTFTPAISIFVTCEKSAEVDALFHQLSPGGEVMMGLDEYPFSKRFAWLADRFGVSWQLAVTPEA